MRVVRHATAEAFLKAAGPLLEGDEAAFNIPLSTARACREDPGRYPGPNLFATVEQGGRVAGVALRLAPYRLQFYAPLAAAEAVAAALGGEALAGAHGPAPAVDAFAAAWSLTHGVPARVKKDLRAYTLAAVTPAPPVPGAMRPAGEADLDLAVAWYGAFLDEATHGDPSSEPAAIAAAALRSGRLHFWEASGRVVAQAAVSGETPTGSRVGGVYTPPAERRRGYATALVGALSARLLAEGRRYCLLFTDLANPVSNSIYPKVGYRPAGDYRDWDFGSPP